MPARQSPLINKEVYHILNKSIAGFIIFNNDNDYHQMLNIINYYQYQDTPCKYSTLKKLNIFDRTEILNQLHKKDNRLVDIIAYCIMPTHFHLILKQLVDSGISKFISNISNSYSKYFNTKYNRHGPLWQSRFKNVLVENNEQLLHLTRYIHLNPMTSKLVNNPEDWQYSSYNEYLTEKESICKFKDLIDLKTINYQKFVNSQTKYQRELHKIKKQILE